MIFEGQKKHCISCLKQYRKTFSTLIGTVYKLDKNKG